jgi:hypothetical protein
MTDNYAPRTRGWGSTWELTDHLNRNGFTAPHQAVRPGTNQGEIEGTTDNAGHGRRKQSREPSS